jgi:uncharacterized membrane protein YidH (DUF202 family)
MERTMLSKKRTRLMLVLTAVAITIGVLGLALDDTTIPIPAPIPDILRAVVMIQAGITIATLVALLKQVYKVRIDRSDELTEPALGLVLSHIVMSLFTVFVLTGWMKTASLTYRTPMAFFGLVIANMVTMRLAKRMIAMADKAKGEMVKLTITLTSRPGLDIDLSCGTRVQQQDPGSKT